MTVALAPPTLGPLCWHVARRSWMGIRVRERQQSSRFIRVATAGAVAYGTALPLLSLYRITTAPIDPGRAVYAVAAIACYLPVQAWLVGSATRAARGRGQRWALAAIAVVIIGMVPVVGVGWLGTLYVLAAMVLVSVRPPWSFLAFAALWATPTPVAFAFGHPQWASYFTLGVPVAAVPLAVVVWQVRAARQLQAARLTLAEEAVVRERLRIDDELRRTVGAALAAIAAQGDRAGGLVGGDPAATARQLRALVGAARQTLADARGMVRGYQEVSLRAELETAAMLLSAAGIQTRLVLPPGELPDTVDEAERTALRRDLARLLGDDQAQARVTITVARHNGRIRLALRSDETDPASAG